MTVELPGVKLDDLEITPEDGLLTIQGERHVTNDAKAEDAKPKRIQVNPGGQTEAIAGSSRTS